MDSYLIRDWLNLGLRWFHVFAAIMWVGQTFFFTWLDRRFHTEKNVWMVHSGGFYEVVKRRKLLPDSSASAMIVDPQRIGIRRLWCYAVSRGNRRRRGT